MILPEKRHHEFLRSIRDEIEYARLVFFLKFSPKHLHSIIVPSSDDFDSAVIILRGSSFDSHINGLLYLRGKDSCPGFLKDFTYEHPLHFRCVPEYIFNSIRDAWHIEESDSFGLWYLHPRTPVPEINSMHKTEQIRKGDIPEVNDNWSFGKGRVSRFIESSIDSQNTFAVYINDRIASYALFRENGSMGMLRTLPEYRNLGLAKIITHEMIKSARKRNWLPHCYIAHDNLVSRRVTEKSGFQFYASQYWFVKS